MSDSRKTNYVGGGIGVGAARILFGLLLQTNTAFSIVIGAFVGLLVGAIWDAQNKKL